MSVKLLLGDALTELKTLPDETVDMTITSPPYYGLRNYGTNPVVWDNGNGCEHRWGSIQKWAGSAYNNEKGDFGGPAKDQIAEGYKTAHSGQFCQRCNAWKGELGSEPTVELYITHLGEIFSDVKRVLKPTGACWINIGDTYAGNGTYIGKYKETHPDHKDLHTNNSGKYPQKVKGYRDDTIKFKSQLCVPERLVLEMMSRGFIKRNTIIWKKPACLPSSAKDRFTNDFEYLFFFVKNEKYYFEQQLEPSKIPETIS